ncbi:t-SNARE coiled-coil homology domain-containing protein [Caenorhabditis elegans]|uniref:t-SNARE coiled-coil homology domain-containing protein n=1 Tax=Caenorhabditis elegans TaxID=6239 RepID=O16248_CAEEL|nr:t-SNARE coiled-coil homology domain-containing protein [Caenorhabditis elegans]CCD67859.1 t-SNARE coiled-coil homology domain-containing protein [Caenorhabditis elegans]|eukprot:NP_504513.1 Uncharacterized protein CELE_F44E7.3 [Caenorhabditis elegans]
MTLQLQELMRQSDEKIEVLELQSRLELAQQASDLTDRLHEDLRASDARVQETFKFLLFQPRNQKKME